MQLLKVESEDIPYFWKFINTMSESCRLQYG